MSTHSTHYATTVVKPISGFLFYCIYYTESDQHWLCSNRRLSFFPTSAKRFSSITDAKAYVPFDFSSGKCEIVLFNFVHSSGNYVSSRSFTCLGGFSDWVAGRFEI